MLKPASGQGNKYLSALQSWFRMMKLLVHPSWCSNKYKKRERKQKKKSLVMQKEIDS